MLAPSAPEGDRRGRVRRESGVSARPCRAFDSRPRRRPLLGHVHRPRRFSSGGNGTQPAAGSDPGHREPAGRPRADRADVGDAARRSGSGPRTRGASPSARCSGGRAGARARSSWSTASSGSSPPTWPTPRTTRRPRPAVLGGRARRCPRGDPSPSRAQGLQRHVARRRGGRPRHVQPEGPADGAAGDAHDRHRRRLGRHRQRHLRARLGRPRGRAPRPGHREPRTASRSGSTCSPAPAGSPAASSRPAGT